MLKGSPEDSPSGFVVLGTIVRPHGLKGEVKVSLSCPGLERLKNCPDLRLVKDGVELKKVSVGRSFMHQDGDAVVRLREVKGLEEAQTLRGAQLAVLERDRPSLPEGTYYQDELVGLEVVTASGERLGTLEEVMDGLANGVCVVRNGPAETLVPALKSVILEVDLGARRMVVQLPEVIDADAASD